MNLRFFYGLVLSAALSVLPATSRAENAPDMLVREREQQTGTAITILFDNSGSMKGEKIRQAKAAFQAWLGTLPEDYKYSLITFEDRGRLVVPLGEHTRDVVAQRVAKLDANTSTPICGALKIAREQIERRRQDVALYERHVVLLFTDGEENIDSRGINGVRADIMALRKQMIEVVGVGFHGEGDYMNGVATRFALANDEQELKRGLDKVDAEVGGADGLVISSEDLVALKGFVPTPVAVIGGTATAADAESASGGAVRVASPNPSGAKGGIHVGWILLAVCGWILVRNLTNTKRAH